MIYFNRQPGAFNSAQEITVDFVMRLAQNWVKYGRIIAFDNFVYNAELVNVCSQWTLLL